MRSKTSLLIVDQIDLVDRQHDVAHAEQRADEGMPPGLHQHALARVDQDHGELGIGGAGRHVAGVLLVPGRIGDDEGAARGREKAIGDVDGDALLALGLEPVDQQREIDIVAGGAVTCRNPWRARKAGLRRSAWNRAAAARSGSTCRRPPTRR